MEKRKSLIVHNCTIVTSVIACNHLKCILGGGKGVRETQLKGEEKCWNQGVGLLLTILDNKTRSPAPTSNAHPQKHCKTQGLSTTMLCILLNQMLTFQNFAGHWMLMPMESTSFLGCSCERQGLGWDNWNDAERKQRRWRKPASKNIYYALNCVLLSWRKLLHNPALIAHGYLGCNHNMIWRVKYINKVEKQRANRRNWRNSLSWIIKNHQKRWGGGA